MDARHRPLETLFSPEQAAKIRSSKVLMVGAGGIGCELLKDLVMAGVGEIHVVDLDTIDLSNLNRQFLFGNKHIKQPKATVAAEVASTFNSNVNIVPYMADITTAQFSPKWFRGFGLVFNALDNAAARRHVNKMCISTAVTLVDVGSEGFGGQSQVILPGETECYDCFSHPTPKTFPVCTIRSTPTQPIHCIVWAKSFLLPTLFGEDSAQEQSQEQDTDAERAQEQAVEQKELVELRASVGKPGFVNKLVQKVFGTDIARLAGMETMWEDREPPVALDIPAEFDPESEAGEDVVAEDQKVWTILENLQALATATRVLEKRAGPVEFDKDDDDTLDFVCAAANLRGLCFSIPNQSKWETKSIAGNIIPAVATTNAIVSGFSTVEALKILAGSPRSDLRSVYIAKLGNKVMTSDKLQPRNPDCAVCSVARSSVKAPKDTKLSDLVEKLLQLKLGYGDVTILTDKLIYDVDYDDNGEKTIGELDLSEKFITVVDDDDRRVDLALFIENGTDLIVDEIDVPLKPTIKRPREDPEEGEDAPAAKDAKMIDEVVELV